MNKYGTRIQEICTRDCVTLGNLHYPCAAAHLFVKQRKYFTAYWENEFISACEVFVNKVCDKHHKKNPH